MVTPQEKLECYQDAYQIIADSIDVFNQKKEAAGADDSTPITMYVMLKSNPTQVYTNFHYIDFFRGIKKTQDQIEYCYRAMRAAVQYLKEYKIPEKLYGIYFIFF